MKGHVSKMRKRRRKSWQLHVYLVDNSNHHKDMHREEEGRQREGAEKLLLRTRVIVRHVEVTVTIIMRNPRKHGSDEMKGDVNGGTTTLVY